MGILTNEIKKAVNKQIEALAEDIQEEGDTDEFDRPIHFSWRESVFNACDKFLYDIREWMACQGIEDLSDEQVDAIYDYAYHEVSCETIKQFA